MPNPFNFMPQQSNLMPPHSNPIQPQSSSAVSIIPPSYNSIQLESINPFLSLIPSSNPLGPSLEEATVDSEILNLKDKMANQMKKLILLKLQLQNENNSHNSMADQLKSLEKKKVFVSKKRRVLDQNKQHQINDEYQDDLDEIKNQRPDGKCQYIKQNNRRCWNEAEEDHSNGRTYCRKCLAKVLLEERNIKRAW